MKRWILVTAFVMLIFTYAIAQTKSNVYQITVGVTAADPTESITFPYPTRDLIIQNNDADSVYTTVDTATVPSMSACTEGTEGCIVMAGSSSFELYDYRTDGVAFRYRGAEASPITVIAIY